MRLTTIVIGLAILSALIFCSCKIQEAPGAYKPAVGQKITKKEKPIKEEEPKEEPKPIVEEPQKALEPEKKAEEPILEEKPEITERPEKVPPVVDEPEIEETQVEEPQPEEKEITRAEKFTVVEEKDEDLLKTYHVVIGSFGVQANATNLQVKMSGSYQPVIVKNERGMYRVILKSFDDYKSAREEIEKIKSMFGDAWVLING